mmetsp:Transcript_6730/g.11123  ORF Transcript_6730/g.11123 Transcript_6730/m.11123 type:complete len:156 (+) Transcript_6730:229-696(+)
MPVCTRQRARLQLTKMTTGKQRQNKIDMKNGERTASRKEDVEGHEPDLARGTKYDALECTVKQDFKQQKCVRWKDLESRESSNRSIRKWQNYYYPQKDTVKLFSPRKRIQGPKRPLSDASTLKSVFSPTIRRNKRSHSYYVSPRKKVRREQMNKI